MERNSRVHSAGWKNASNFWAASGDISNACRSAAIRAAALVRSNIYLTRTLGTGRFPALATVIRDGARLDADQTFRIGLDFVLAGIEARISR